MRRNDVDLDGTGVARVPSANLPCVALWMSWYDVITGCHSRMPQEDATAECHSKLSQQEVTAACRSRMSQEDVTGGCHSRMSQQDVTAGCHNKMLYQSITAANHSSIAARCHSKTIIFIKRMIFEYLRPRLLFENRSYQDFRNFPEISNFLQKYQRSRDFRL